MRNKHAARFAPIAFVVANCLSITACEDQKGLLGSVGDGGIDTIVDTFGDAAQDAPSDAFDDSDTGGIPVTLPDGFFADPPANCGNGVRDPGEACDDGNNVSYDGCERRCTFENVQRISFLLFELVPTDACPNNALGGAFSFWLHEPIQKAIEADIASGHLSMFYHFLEPANPLAQNTSQLYLGASDGSPLSSIGYDGSADRDWWYQVRDATLTESTVPIPQTLAGARFLNSGSLRIGPASLPLQLNLTGSAGGPLIDLTLIDATLTAPIGAATRPTASVGMPPGHPSATHLDPTLVAVENFGAPGATSGVLCGEITAAEMATVPPPAVLAGFCSENYGAAASLLDVIVGGCDSPLFGQLTIPTQPDGDDARVADVGSGAPYRLEAREGTRVNRCFDGDNNAVPLQGCLQDASFSSYFRIALTRVVLRD